MSGIPAPMVGANRSGASGVACNASVLTCRKMALTQGAKDQRRCTGCYSSDQSCRRQSAGAFAYTTARGKGWSLGLRGERQRLEPSLTQLQEAKAGAFIAQLQEAKAGAFAYNCGRQRLEPSLTRARHQEAKAGAFAYTTEAKAGAFAYQQRQRLEPSLTAEGQRLEPSLTIVR